MTRFERDVSRMNKRGEDMEKFTAVITGLCSREPLASGNKDHPLKRDWKGWRDCHVAPDWIIIYRITDYSNESDRTWKIWRKASLDGGIDPQ